jgi:hypothetical protein
VAQQLQKLGIKHVRPLQGGFLGWKKLNFPLVESEIVQWNAAGQSSSTN